MNLDFSNIDYSIKHRMYEYKLARHPKSDVEVLAHGLFHAANFDSGRLYDDEMDASNSGREVGQDKAVRKGKPTAEELKKAEALLTKKDGDR